MPHYNATCMACGEQGHPSATCKTLRIPPDGFYTGGGGGGGGHSHDEDDERASHAVLSGWRWNSLGGGFLSTQREPVSHSHGSPNRPSNGAVQEA